MTGEQERNGKEVVMANFLILSQNLLGITKKNHGNFNQESQWPFQYSNQVPVKRTLNDRVSKHGVEENIWI
jgi:hypothetical protein